MQIHQLIALMEDQYLEQGLTVVSKMHQEGKIDEEEKGKIKGKSHEISPP